MEALVDRTPPRPPDCYSANASPSATRQSGRFESDMDAAAVVLSAFHDGLRDEAIACRRPTAFVAYDNSQLRFLAVCASTVLLAAYVHCAVVKRKIRTETAGNIAFASDALSAVVLHSLS